MCACVLQPDHFFQSRVQQLQHLPATFKWASSVLLARAPMLACGSGVVDLTECATPALDAPPLTAPAAPKPAVSPKLVLALRNSFRRRVDDEVSVNPKQVKQVWARVCAGGRRRVTGLSC